MINCECGNFQPKLATGLTWSTKQQVVCKNCGRDEPDLANQFMIEMEFEVESQEEKIVRLEMQLMFFHVAVEDAIEILSESPEESDIDSCIEALNKAIS